MLIIVGALQVIAPFIQVPRTIHLEVPTPHSEGVATETFTVSASTAKTLQYFLNGGDNLTILLSVASKEKESNLTMLFYVPSEEEKTIRFLVSDNSTTYLSYPRTSGIHDFVWTVPASTNYSFLYDNTFSSYPKLIHFQLTKEYRVYEKLDVPFNGRLAPLIYAYIGATFIFIGAVMATFGFLRKNRNATPQPLSPSQSDMNVRYGATA